MKKLLIITGLALGIAMPSEAMALTQQADSTAVADMGVMYVDPLFEYPIAPEEIESFGQKCDWLVENFWNPLDVKVKGTVDQGKLNHAFNVFATSCQYAQKAKVTAAIQKLYKAIQKNPSLLFQMTKAAEETIYGPRAEVWIDELYVEILRNALEKKKFPKNRRDKYELQLKQLENSLIDSAPASFDFTRSNGDPAKYFPMSTPTLIFFGDPDCDDCRMAKLRMQSNVAFSKAVTDGKINVLYIIPDAETGWESKVTDYPHTWAVGASDTVSDLMDIRDMPDVYVIGGDGKIVTKHVGLMQAMQTALEQVNKKD